MATVPTPEVSLAVLARSDDSLIEPPQPVIRAESAADNTPPNFPREAAASYSPSHRSDTVDPDNPGGSGGSANPEDADSRQTSGDVVSLSGEETGVSPEAAAADPAESHQINFFA